MGEVMMMMMISSPENNPTNETICQEPITATNCSWKLYEIPFYNSQYYQSSRCRRRCHHHQCQNNNHIHQLHPPLSARKIAASFWDLPFFRPMTETQLDIAQAQIIELKAELDYERKARKRAESVNKRVARELAEERRGREAMERLCEEFARDISSDKKEIHRIKREMEEESRMMRMAEVLREGGVQMKLTEAKIFFEEKISELEETKTRSTQMDTSTSRTEQLRKNQEDKFPGFLISSSHSLSGKFSRRTPSEPENPHIKRGIKGFVEFPRVVRAIGSRSRHWGTKLECQKAQLRILLKQRSPVRSNNLIVS